MQNHPDWGGAVLSADGDKNPDFSQFLGSHTLDGALVRFVSQDVMKQARGWGVKQCRDDLLNHFRNASQEQIEGLSDFLRDSLSRLNRLDVSTIWI